jgi:hypothetical protein
MPIAQHGSRQPARAIRLIRPKPVPSNLLVGSLEEILPVRKCDDTVSEVGTSELCDRFDMNPTDLTKLTDLIIVDLSGDRLLLAADYTTSPLQCAMCSAVVTYLRCLCLLPDFLTGGPSLPLSECSRAVD